MIGPMTDDTHVSAAANAGGYLPSRVIIDCIILPEAAASASAEPDMLEKMMLCTTLTWAKPAAETTDDRVAEVQQPVHDAAGVHELGGEDEQRDRQQQLAGHHAVQQLLGRRPHVDARQEQPENGPADHRVGDRQSDQAQPDDGEERKRKRAGQVHSPEVALVMSASSGASPRSRLTIAQR